MKTLLALATLQGLLYAIIAWFAFDFSYGTSAADRPLLTVVGLLVCANILYLASIVVSLRLKPGWQLAGLIIVGSVIYRLLLLPTPPIQEIDIYRYVWDGAVTAHGLNPYRYSPAQAIAAAESTSTQGELEAYDVIQKDSSAVAVALERVHYADLTTVYPPVSQAVFAIGDWTTSDRLSIDGRVVALKSLLVCFDLATILIILGLLRMASMHLGWAIAYAWCPLVMKEFANSGHLDSIAVFFCMAAVLCAAKLIVLEDLRMSWRWALAATLLLSVAIGAKLYPVVLLPLFAGAVARRLGVGRAIAATVLCVAVAALLLSPMFIMRREDASSTQKPAVASAMDPSNTTELGEAVILLPPPEAIRAEEGLSSFLMRWEMNDLLFMLVLENLRPQASNPSEATPWFALTPERWREAIVGPIAGWLGTQPRAAAFLVARFLTSFAFVAVAIALACRGYRDPRVTVFLESAFLTLAWFWLLSPTQNPWYWTWALPLAAFARGRAWFLVAGLVLAYYLRFWLQAHYASTLVLGTGYVGPQFFDYVVVPLEFGPWLVLLTAFAARRHWLSRVEQHKLGAA